MIKPIRCIECYKKRPGGRCEFCPLHRENKDKFISIDEKFYIKSNYVSSPSPSDDEKE